MFLLLFFLVILLVFSGCFPLVVFLFLGGGGGGVGFFGLKIWSLVRFSLVKSVSCIMSCHIMSFFPSCVLLHLGSVDDHLEVDVGVMPPQPWKKYQYPHLIAGDLRFAGVECQIKYYRYQCQTMFESLGLGFWPGGGGCLRCVWVLPARILPVRIGQ